MGKWADFFGKLKIRIFLGFALCASLIGIVLSFQNCSDAKLSAFVRMGSLDVPDTVVTVTPPAPNDNEIRVMVFVDQSYSMIHGKCQSDLDGSTPAESGVGCATPEQGIDPSADRYAVMQKWMDELVAKGKAKISLIPFSGGAKARPFKAWGAGSEKIADFQFLDLPTGQLRLTKLLTEHVTDNAKNPNDAMQFMGTTVPLTTLRLARDILFQEMSTLQTQGKLFGTTFRFIYISDGVFKPTEQIINTAFSIAGCSRACLVDSTVAYCSQSYASGYVYGKLPPGCDLGAGAYVGTVEDCFCLNIGNDLFASFGDPANNDYRKVISTLDMIAGLAKYFGEGILKMDLVKVHPERVSPNDKDPIGTNPPIKDIFDQVSKDEAKARTTEIIDTNPPFSIVGGLAGNASFKLSAFYVVNLNAMVDQYGKFIADSDGDGVPDDIEIADGTDPRDPRTPDPSDGVRYCLDGINKEYGCKKSGCTPTLDADGDGLNECEEYTIGSDPMQKDFDGDEILDYLEVVKGLNPIQDDRVNDSNSDGRSDISAFMFGVHPLADFDSVYTEFLAKYRLAFLKYVPVVDATGKTVLTASYNLKVDNIPLINTLSTNVGSELYYAKVPSSASRIPANALIGPTPHGKFINEVLFVAEVHAVQDPNYRYWLFLRKQVKVPGVNSHVTMSIDFSEFTQLRDVGN